VDEFQSSAAECRKDGIHVVCAATASPPSIIMYICHVQNLGYLLTYLEVTHDMSHYLSTVVITFLRISYTDNCYLHLDNDITLV